MNMEELNKLKERVLSMKHESLGCRCFGHVFSNMIESKIMIVGQAPSLRGNKTEPFTGIDKDIFDDMLKFLDLSRDKVYITNLIKCATFVFNGFLVNFWKPILKEEIDILKPEVIILLGKKVSFSLHNFIEDNIKVFSCPHPASILYGYDTETFFNGFRELRDFINSNIYKHQMINNTIIKESNKEDG